MKTPFRGFTAILIKEFIVVLRDPSERVNTMLVGLASGRRAATSERLDGCARLSRRPGYVRGGLGRHGRDRADQADLQDVGKQRPANRQVRHRGTKQAVSRGQVGCERNASERVVGQQREANEDHGTRKQHQPQHLVGRASPRADNWVTQEAKIV